MVRLLLLLPTLLFGHDLYKQGNSNPYVHIGAFGIQSNPQISDVPEFSIPSTQIQVYVGHEPFGSFSEPFKPIYETKYTELFFYPVTERQFDVIYVDEFVSANSSGTGTLEYNTPTNRVEYSTTTQLYQYATQQFIKTGTVYYPNVGKYGSQEDIFRVDTLEWEQEVTKEENRIISGDNTSGFYMRHNENHYGYPDTDRIELVYYLTGNGLDEPFQKVTVKQAQNAKNFNYTEEQLQNTISRQQYLDSLEKEREDRQKYDLYTNRFSDDVLNQAIQVLIAQPAKGLNQGDIVPVKSVVQGIENPKQNGVYEKGDQVELLEAFEKQGIFTPVGIYTVQQVSLTNSAHIKFNGVWLPEKLRPMVRHFPPNQEARVTWVGDGDLIENSFFISDYGTEFIFVENPAYQTPYGNLRDNPQEIEFEYLDTRLSNNGYVRGELEFYNQTPIYKLYNSSNQEVSSLGLRFYFDMQSDPSVGTVGYRWYFTANRANETYGHDVMLRHKLLGSDVTGDYVNSGLSSNYVPEQSGTETIWAKIKEKTGANYSLEYHPDSGKHKGYVMTHSYDFLNNDIWALAEYTLDLNLTMNNPASPYYSTNFSKSFYSASVNITDFKVIKLLLVTQPLQHEDGRVYQFAKVLDNHPTDDNINNLAFQNKYPFRSATPVNQVGDMANYKDVTLYYTSTQAGTEFQRHYIDLTFNLWFQQKG